MITDRELADGEIEWEIVTDPAEAAEIRTSLERFGRDHAALAAAHDEMLGKWPEHWVSMFEGRLFHAPELDQLLVQLRGDGIEPGHAATRRMTRRLRYGPRLILE